MGGLLSLCGSGVRKDEDGGGMDIELVSANVVDKRSDDSCIDEPIAKPDIIRFFMAGLGSAGKTTVIRQLQLLSLSDNKRYKMCDEDWKEGNHEALKTDYENNAVWIQIVRKNILDSLNLFVKQVEEEELVYDTEDNLNFSIFLSDAMDEDESWEYFKENRKDPLQDIINLFEDSTFLQVMTHKNKIKVEGKRLFDGCDHFLKTDKINQVFGDQFVPDEEDKVRCRNPTQDMHTYRFKIYDTNIEIYDVGGQKSERAKVGEYLKYWANLGSPNAKNFILLVVAMSDYNEPLTEFEGTLLDECLEYMKNLLENPFASKCGLLIFFNKKDRFLQKLKDEDCRQDIHYLKAYLDKKIIKEYKADGSFKEEDMHRAIASKFAEIINSNKIKRERDTYVRFTCAIDKIMMESIFGTVYYEIMRERQSKDDLFP
uniref:G-protein alpha subunit n=1 Tax=Rhabditophanes sp. KR3021 TaxID=114890 RepID=A0AC35UD39_9BILA